MRVNIFVLHSDPVRAASYHCDKHVCKMVIESAQMLSTAHVFYGNDAPYKESHVNHPCSKWVRESLDNYRWLCNMSLTLCKEYIRRYGKIHKCQKAIEWAIENEPPVESVGLTPFAQAMPEQYRDDDAVDAYRKYYLGEKSRFAKWKMGDIPSWYKEKLG